MNTQLPLPPDPVLSKPVKSQRKSGRTITLVISLIVHALIIGAATYVVTTVQQPRHEEFQSGPPVDAKPMVQTVRPPDPVNERREEGAAALTQRVTVDSPNLVALPEMPDTSSSADGLRGATGSGLGGFGSGSELPSAPLSSVRGDFNPLFGVKESSGKTTGLLVGRLYDFKQTPDRKMNPELEKKGGLTVNGLGTNELELSKTEIAKFIKAGWKDSSLTKFFQAPEPLYAAHIFIPRISALQAPKEFGVGDIVAPRAWMARYTGRISPPADGIYRFVGYGDDFLYVRVNKRLVLDGSLQNLGLGFTSDRPKKPAQYVYRPNEIAARLTVGHRIEMRVGSYYDIDIIVCEAPGGVFNAYLLYEKEGETYEQDALGNPILPVLRLDNSPIPVSAEIPFKADSPLWRSEEVKGG